MSEKEWTPADIGGTEHPPHQPMMPYPSWTFDRKLSDEDILKVRRYFVNKWMQDHPRRLPLDHPGVSGKLPEKAERAE